MPLEHGRPITAQRQALAARWSVDATPCARRKPPSEARSRCQRLAQRPASSARAWARSLQGHHRASQARHAPPGGGALALGQQVCHAGSAHGPQAARGGSRFAAPPSGAAAMGPAGGAVRPPAWLDAVASAAHEAWPLLPHGGTGGVRALGRQESARPGSGAQGPAPGPGLGAIPGRRSARADGGWAGQRGTGLIVRHEGGRAPVQELWHRPQAQREVQAGGAAVGAEASCGAGPAGACTRCP